MSFIIAMQDLSNKSHAEIKQINATDPDRKQILGDYEDKELYHELNEREYNEKLDNPEKFNYELK